MTTDEQVRAVLARMGRDAVRTAKFVDQLNNALAVRTPQILTENLRLIPPPGPDADDSTPWLPLRAVEGESLASAAPRDSAHAALAAPPGVVPGMDPALSADLSAAWSRFRLAWLSEDAQGVNAGAVELATLVRAVNPDLYPPDRRLAFESLYLDMNNFTWVWIVYLFSVVFLVMAVVYRWAPARIVGVSLFTLAFALHTLAILLRWYIAGRWPNSNMFEAVTTAAWFGGAGAVLLEALARRAPMRTLFFLGSAVASMAALMAADFMPLDLSPAIGNMMPILHDVWLYIRTNVIIFSYVLIAMAAVTAILYLLYRLGGAPDSRAAARAPCSTCRARRTAGVKKATAGEVFDGATMVLLELAFILLWAGTIRAPSGPITRGDAPGAGTRRRSSPSTPSSSSSSSSTSASRSATRTLDRVARAHRLRRHDLQLDRHQLRDQRPAQLRVRRREQGVGSRQQEREIAPANFHSSCSLFPAPYCLPRTTIALTSVRCSSAQRGPSRSTPLSLTPP